MGLGKARLGSAKEDQARQNDFLFFSSRLHLTMWFVAVCTCSPPDASARIAPSPGSFYAPSPVLRSFPGSTLLPRFYSPSQIHHLSYIDSRLHVNAYHVSWTN
ncbi:hypothetical protein PMIN04_005544 [Paraphaeosphaeria minitans]